MLQSVEPDVGKTSILLVMVPLASYATLEEAERAGAVLLDHEISADLRGQLGRGGPVTIFVQEECVREAEELLDLSAEPPPEVRQPFRPCPLCGTGDPVWYGKRKALLLIAAFLLLLCLAILRSPRFMMTAAAAVAIFSLSLWLIPEFECRRCHHRWTRSSG